MGRKRQYEYNPVAFKPQKAPHELTIWDGFELWREHHLVDKNGSEDTVTNYRSDLKKLVQYLEEHGKEPLLHLVTEDIIQAFIIDYQNRENPAPNTMARLKSSLKAIFSYLATLALHKEKTNLSRAMTPKKQPNS